MILPDFDKADAELLRTRYFYDYLELGRGCLDLGYSYQYKIRRKWILDAVESLVPPGRNVLDVAGASGNFSLPLAEKGYAVTWNDLRPEMLELVKRKYEFGNVDYAIGNIFDLAQGWAGHFDGVIAAEVIEHMAHPDEFLISAALMLKPGGHLFLSTPNGRYFRSHLPRFSDCPDPSAFESIEFKPGSDGHIFLLHPDELQMLAAKAGLVAKQIETMTNPLTRGHVKLGHLLPVLPTGVVKAIESGSRKLPRPIRERIHCQMAAVFQKRANTATQDRSELD